MRTQDAEQYGFNGVSQEASIFMNQPLDAPALNITTSYFYDPSLYGSATDFAKEDQKKILWMWANETYDYDYLSQKGMCQSSGRIYQWGFSSIQLFCMDIMLLVWTIGIVTMWWRAQSTMLKRGRDSVAGTHKAVLELAAAMSRELDVDVIDHKTVSEEQVQERIAERCNCPIHRFGDGWWRIRGGIW
ncbi:uncharacterized protein J4E79_007620 [Alternaria viburni]|uniref:uncharacterized protein n=1 Tax=Alternaria viburni TaxID=566460 RepID=UPI0020C58478|nr:uncharacterized protein J4E79_007620 [Alternaria viburni]KAI4657005.1 hypothetical protein J4E79_007620 [Alternaria viburni]